MLKATEGCVKIYAHGKRREIKSFFLFNVVQIIQEAMIKLSKNKGASIERKGVIE